MRVEGTAGRGSRKSRSARRSGQRSATWAVEPAGPLSTVHLARLRLTRSIFLLGAVSVGILLSVILVCTVPLYTTLMSDIQLHETIAANGPIAANIEVKAHSTQVTSALYDDAHTVMQAIGHRYLYDVTSGDPLYYAVSDEVLQLQAGATTFDPGRTSTPHAQVYAFDFARIASHIHVIAGHVPTSSGGSQALIPKAMAEQEHIKPGDQVVVTEFGNHTQHLTLTVAAVFTPVSARDPFWNGLTLDAATSGQAALYPVITDQKTFFSGLPALHSVGMDQHWVYYTDASAITIDNMAAIGQQLGDFQSHVNGNLVTIQGISTVSVLGSLGNTITSVTRQEALLALPLYIIVAQVIGLALLFVAAMSGLLIEAQSQDIATLKSRGASGTQVLSTFTLQGIVVSLGALVLGPLLAGLLSVALARWFVPSATLASAGISSGYLAQFQHPERVIVPGLLGSALGVIVVALTAFRSARLDVLAFRREQGRVSRQPFWKRYYLDLVLALLCLAGYLELNQFGSVSTRLALGGSGASLLQLATPALLLLAGSLLVLRLLPLVAGMGARVFARRRGLTPLLAFSQVERTPGRYSSMTLLLVLAVGLGLFALSFDASLTRNVADRTAYATGADIRTVQRAAEGDAQGIRIRDLIAGQPGVSAVAPVYRTQASTTLDQGGKPVDVLAIDPATFGQVAGPVSWRADYATAPLSSLLATMRRHALTEAEATQAASAGSMGSVPLWALVSQQFATIMHVKTGDKVVLQLNEIPFQPETFVVGGVVREFPTLYPSHAAGSFVVLSTGDLFNVLRAAERLQNGDTSLVGPNEYWIRTMGGSATDQRLARTLAGETFDTQRVLSLASAQSLAASNPTAAGMRGLLLIGAITAALLAIMGSLVQSLLATRRRALQFAVLRTVGMTGRQLTALLLGEHVMMYLFGLVAGTLLGLLLVTATLPFLQFSDTTINPAMIGIPPYQVALEPERVLMFYGALIVAFMIALAITARHATTLGLGRALRIGED